MHVITQKGRGYQPAEDDASRFHGIGSFEKETGTLTAKPSAMSYTEAFGRTLTTLAESDDRVVAITAAMPAGTGLTHVRRGGSRRGSSTSASPSSTP